jgi:hypothetical protein
MHALFIKHQGTEDAYVIPELSSHIWECNLLGLLAPGVHTGIVRLTDQFGQTFEDSLVFEVMC